MGLKDQKKQETKSKFTEEHSLGLVGIPDHDTDKMIDEYFAKERRKKTSTLVRPKESFKPDKEITNRGVLKVKTFGFKNGVLQHNMPCPVCLENPAVFTSDDGINFFGPCEECQEKGFFIKKHIERKNGWFS